MTNAIPVEEADRLLDELEDLARSKTSNADFNEQFLDRLKFLVNAQSATILSIFPPDRWLLVAQAGEMSSSANDAFRSRFAQHPNFDHLMEAEASTAWYAFLLRSDDLVHGCILLTFSGPILPSATPALDGLTTAFGEILSIRQHKQLESEFGANWTKYYALNQQIATCSSPNKAASVLVNQLLPIVSAARISLASQAGAMSLQNARLVAVSGVSTIDSSSLTIKSLEKIAGEALKQSDPIVRQASMHQENVDLHEATPLTDGTFQNIMALRFFHHSSQAADERDILILEWTSREAMLDAAPAITHFLPSLCTSWQQQNRWLHVPAIVRNLWMLRPSSLLKRLSIAWIRPLFVLGLLTIGVWFLMRPYPLTIEAEAILEPVSRRAIHASVDGFMDQLLVEDGQAVQQGQVLAKLRSPTLDLQVEEAIGQIRAFAEKRNGLRVAVNQLASNTPDALATQTRLSADISLLETQEKLAKEKLDFLTKEKSKLTIESPIEGVIVSRELRRELESRPLRRGDALFGIVNLQADWQLNIRVADRDAGYLMAHYGDSKQQVTFVFDSIPEEQFKGEITKISSVMESYAGKESFLAVFANVEREIAKKAHVGANARVFFTCGSQPTWFVWCRPLVEAVQKRVWLFFDDTSHSAQDSKHAD